MKRYHVRSAPGQQAVLEVLSSSTEGHQVRITRHYDTYQESEESFMPRELFELCVKTAYIVELNRTAQVA